MPAVYFIKVLRSLALGEFIPYEWFNAKMKQSLNVEAENSYFESNGVMLLAAAVLLMIALLVVGLGYCCKKHIEKVNSIKRILFWNTFIRYSMQAYLKLAVANFAGLYLL